MESSTSGDNKNGVRTKVPKMPYLGVGDVLGAGDSYLVADVLPEDLAEVAFDKMKKEVEWKTMHHRGGEVPRLVAVEGEVAEDGSFPIYRHPADESPPLSPFSPTVALIREHVQRVRSCVLYGHPEYRERVTDLFQFQILNHPVNHVLIQLYRSGKDYISDHSDKTIDVVRGSSIVNVSLGAKRVMTLRLKKTKLDTTSSETVDASTKVDSVATDKTGGNQLPEPAPRQAQRIPLPHNSMFVMGLETNAKWMHGINHDNRPFKIKSPEEQVEEGARISLTFRHIGTFLSKDESQIWGQGATRKTKELASNVINDPKEVKRLIQAFGDENQRSDFDWDDAYGGGYDVLHLASKDDDNSDKGPKPAI